MADGRTYPPRPILAVSAAIIRNGKVLIVRRARAPASGVYTLPGGGVEIGDCPQRGIIRGDVAPASELTGLGRTSRHRADTVLDLRSFPTNNPRGVSNDIP
jgi:ADP-ribose pyrophosphatase YjhB (NUDIX family)